MRSWDQWVLLLDLPGGHLRQIRKKVIDLSTVCKIYFHFKVPERNSSFTSVLTQFVVCGQTGFLCLVTPARRITGWVRLLDMCHLAIVFFSGNYSLCDIKANLTIRESWEHRTVSCSTPVRNNKPTSSGSGLELRTNNCGSKPTAIALRSTRRAILTSSEGDPVLRVDV